MQRVADAVYITSINAPLSLFLLHNFAEKMDCPVRCRAVSARLGHRPSRGDMKGPGRRNPSSTLNLDFGRRILLVFPLYLEFSNRQVLTRRVAEVIDGRRVFRPRDRHGAPDTPQAYVRQDPVRRPDLHRLYAQVCRLAQRSRFHADGFGVERLAGDGDGLASGDQRNHGSEGYRGCPAGLREVAARSFAHFFFLGRLNSPRGACRATVPTPRRRDAPHVRARRRDRAVGPRWPIGTAIPRG